MPAARGVTSLSRRLAVVNTTAGTVAGVQWRPVLGHEDRFKVSSDGSVVRLDRVTTYMVYGKVVNKHYPEMRLTPWLSLGYPCVDLYTSTGVVKKRVHTLVLEAFKGAPLPGQCARHLNGNPTDNRLENLEWGSYSENNYDIVRHGNHKESRKLACPMGHLLAEPNLCKSQLKLGRRTCWACTIAHSAKDRAFRKGLSFDFATVADQNYHKLVSGYVPSKSGRWRLEASRGWQINAAPGAGAIQVPVPVARRTANTVRGDEPAQAHVRLGVPDPGGVRQHGRQRQGRDRDTVRGDGHPRDYRDLPVYLASAGPLVITVSR